MQGMLTFIVIVILGFFGFIIYFNFKVIQFILTATNLYKKMVSRQDAMVKLLIDIRDNTKSYNIADVVEDTVAEEDLERLKASYCYHCGTPVSDKDQDKPCQSCGKNIFGK
jgi:hypothetical protein